jgi:hypothetical protein
MKRFLKFYKIILGWAAGLAELKITYYITRVHLYSAFPNPLLAEIPLILGNRTVEVITMGFRPIYL